MVKNRNIYKGNLIGPIFGTNFPGLSNSFLSKNTSFSYKDILEEGKFSWIFICSYSPKFARPAALNEKEFASHSWD